MGVALRAAAEVHSFELLQEEDPEGNRIASIVSQVAISARYSGAAIVDNDGELRIEGVAGWGDRFMKGEVAPDDLPSPARLAVIEVYEKARAVLGPVRFEWVYDGETAWIVQLHVGSTRSSKDRLVPGNAARWGVFDVADGLEKLRDVLVELKPGTGLKLKGRVGLTSHIADAVRRANIDAARCVRCRRAGVLRRIFPLRASSIRPR